MVSHTFLVAFAALVAERFFGYPGLLLRAIGHPVMWIGSIIALLERNLNQPARGNRQRLVMGVCSLIATIAVVAAITFPLAWICRQLPYPIGAAAEALLAMPFIAQFDLRRFVKRVAVGLKQGIDQGRTAVSHIVGRDPMNLDRSGISRAALESLAENTSDGIVAPLFWLALLGLPGIAVYKVINTADSMIGHRNERYQAFGWSSARLDDLANWIPARITALLFAGAQSLTNPKRGAASLHVSWRDARKHRSPNAGWPESALAGALDIRLGGSRSYGGQVVDLPWLGDGRIEIDEIDIMRGLRLYGQTLTLLAILMLAAWGISP